MVAKAASGWRGRRADVPLGHLCLIATGIAASGCELQVSPEDLQDGPHFRVGEATLSLAAAGWARSVGDDEVLVSFGVAGDCSYFERIDFSPNGWRVVPRRSASVSVRVWRVRYGPRGVSLRDLDGLRDYLGTQATQVAGVELDPVGFLDGARDCVTLPATSRASIASEIEDVFATTVCASAAFYIPSDVVLDDGYSDARAFDVRFSFGSDCK